MESKSFHKPINLLVLAESNSLQDRFINNLQGCIQNADNYKPYDIKKLDFRGKITFRALYHEFNIFYGPGISESSTPYEIFLHFIKIQDHFIKPINLNAIIFLMQADPRCHEYFLSLNLFNNFSEDDMKKIKRNVIFVFKHNIMEPYQKRGAVNVKLRTVLERIQADLLDSLTLHYEDCLNWDFCEKLLKFLNRNKKTLPVETVYSHESVLKTVGNEDFLDLLLDALYVNEINIENEATVEKKQYCLIQFSYSIICTNKKCLKSCHTYGSPRESLENESTCSTCNCSVKDHKLSKHTIQEQRYNYDYAWNQKEYRQILISAIVTIDVFHKENNASVGQLHCRLMERMKQETSYSVLETLYKNEVDSHKKGITADDCMKRVRSSLISLKELVYIGKYYESDPLLFRGNLRAKN